MSRWPFGRLARHAYDFAMIDPPWSFDLWSDKGAAKSPQAQYDCMSMEEICTLPVRQLFAERGALWLWCTWPLVAKGLHAGVLASWGLHPITGGSWAKRTRTGKLRWGGGFVIRSTNEPFILAGMRDEHHRMRGRAVNNLIESIGAVTIDGLAREHSRKPDEAYYAAEQLTPGARRADVYSRQRRLGWDGYGRELDKFPAITIPLDYRGVRSEGPTRRTTRR